MMCLSFHNPTHNRYTLNHSTRFFNKVRLWSIQSMYMIESTAQFNSDYWIYRLGRLCMVGTCTYACIDVCYAVSPLSWSSNISLQPRTYFKAPVTCEAPWLGIKRCPSFLISSDFPFHCPTLPASPPLSSSGWGGKDTLPCLHFLRPQK